MIDEAMAKRVSQAQATAITEGWDMAETLDLLGLLLTGERVKAAQANILTTLIALLESQPVTVYQQLGGGQPTVADTAKGVIEYVKMYAQLVDKT